MKLYITLKSQDLTHLTSQQKDGATTLLYILYKLAYFNSLPLSTLFQLPPFPLSISK